MRYLWIGGRIPRVGVLMPNSSHKVLNNFSVVVSSFNINFNKVLDKQELVVEIIINST